MNTCRCRFSDFDREYYMTLFVCTCVIIVYVSPMYTARVCFWLYSIIHIVYNPLTEVYAIKYVFKCVECPIIRYFFTNFCISDITEREVEDDSRISIPDSRLPIPNSIQQMFQKPNKAYNITLQVGCIYNPTSIIRIPLASPTI